MAQLGARFHGMEEVVGSIPTAPTNLLHFTAFVLGLTPIYRLTPIELIHCKLLNPRRTVFNCTALLVTYHVRIDSQRDSWIRSSWCRMNLADRATKVGLAPIYGRLNRLFSWFIHGTIVRLTRHFVLEKDKDRIAIPPSLSYCNLALISVYQMMCFMVATLAKTFGWKPVHPIETLVVDFKYAWNITEPAEAAEKK